ncbi:MAG: AraC family transcriptional regulator [Kofleriaceae bacterium]|nr:AraC family transcriptional regulator [Kofleriaceae bacterium]
MAKKTATREEYERRVLRAQEYISSHLDEEIRPQEIAKITGFSVHHFHRIFRGLTEESVMGFARRLRLERGARYLRSSKRPVVDIALEAGYGSHEAFTRAFSERFLLSPMQFRAEKTAGNASPAPTPCEPRVSVIVRTEPALDVLYMQHRGPYLEVGVVWERFVTWVLANNLIDGPDAFAQRNMFGLVPDDPDTTPTELLRYKACLLHSRQVALPDGPVAQSQIPGGRYAVAVHRGSYETLHETYLDLIGRWFPQSSYVPAHSPVVEHYLNSPQDTAPALLETEVRVLIAEAGWN